MISTAIIGVSGFAHWHYRDLVDLAKEGKVRIAAATIINQPEEPEKCRVLREMGCEIFDDYRDMLDVWKGRLDLCVIPTGIYLHARMTVAALRAGCHVLVEKPAAGTVDEIDAMRSAEAQTKHFVAVGYQHIYSAEVQRMKRAICDGLIGDVQVIKCQGYWPRSEGYYRRNNWAGRLKVGEDWIFDAPFSNAFAHYLNLSCFFSGKCFEASCHPRSVEAELYRVRLIETADTACLRIETEENIPLLLWVTHSCEKVRDLDSGPELEVRGSAGSLIWTPDGVTHRLLNGAETVWPASNFDEIRSAMFDSLLRKVSGKDAFVCNLDIARVPTLCANIAFDSSKVNVIGPGFLSSNGEEGDRYTAIRGIERQFAEAFRQEKLLSELGVPWAHPGRKVSIPGDRSTGELLRELAVRLNSSSPQPLGVQ